MTNLFEAPATTVSTENAYELLVGDGKKYKTNEDLAKANLEKDAFIERLKNEAAEVRNELNTRIAEETFTTRERPTTPSNNVTTTVAERQVPNEGNTADVAKIAADVYTKQKQLEQRAANATVAVNKLKQVWGDSAVQRLEQTASSLHLSKDVLQDLAEKSPEAFFKMIGLTDTVGANNVVPPRNNVNTAATLSSDRGNIRDEQYWDKVKQADPKRYYSAEAYNQRHKDALALGENYFNA